MKTGLGLSDAGGRAAHNAGGCGVNSASEGQWPFSSPGYAFSSVVALSTPTALLSPLLLLACSIRADNEQALPGYLPSRFAVFVLSCFRSSLVSCL